MARRGNNNNNMPLEIAQLLNSQNQLIQLLTQNMQNNNNNNPPPPPPPPPQQDRLTRFLRLNPPTLSSSSETIVADDWLRTTNKKLDTVQVVGADRVRFAAHQLEGPAAEWWDNYRSPTLILKLSPGTSSRRPFVLIT